MGFPCRVEGDERHPREQPGRASAGSPCRAGGLGVINALTEIGIRLTLADHTLNIKAPEKEEPAGIGRDHINLIASRDPACPKLSVGSVRQGAARTPPRDLDLRLTPQRYECVAHVLQPNPHYVADAIARRDASARGKRSSLFLTRGCSEQALPPAPEMHRPVSLPSQL